MREYLGIPTNAKGAIEMYIQNLLMTIILRKLSY